MEQINLLTSKYAQTDVQTDSTLPYKYIPDILKELISDMIKFNKICDEESDSKIVKKCEILKSKLHSMHTFLKTKMEAIPNKHYMEESDEEWVDQNNPPVKRQKCDERKTVI